jgi:hypothetical protein
MDKDLTKVIESLQWVQNELHAPKNQNNNFGNYNYRSCEDILSAVKPLLAKKGAIILLSDKVEMKEMKKHMSVYNKETQEIEKESRVDFVPYVVVTARFITADGELSVNAEAREPITKKGMDDAQITGATSSYARKYALNGLLLIDDVKDNDSHDNR